MFGIMDAGLAASRRPGMTERFATIDRRCSHEHAVPTGGRRPCGAAAHVLPSIRRSQSTTPAQECRVVQHSKNWPPMSELGQGRRSRRPARNLRRTSVSRLADGATAWLFRATTRLLHRNKNRYSITSSAMASNDGGTSRPRRLRGFQVGDQLKRGRDNRVQPCWSLEATNVETESAMAWVVSITVGVPPN
jgi:hypothetical protein